MGISEYHLTRCIEFSIGKSMFPPMILFYRYLKSDFDEVLDGFDSEVRTEFLRMTETFNRSFTALLDFLEKGSMRRSLDKDDFEYLSYAEKGLMNKEIATMKNLSLATISKKFSLLQEKTGTHSKKELAELYRKLMTTMDI